MYGDLISLDTGELESRLATLDTNVEGLTYRVKSIEDGGYPLDVDKVHDLITDYAETEDLMDRTDVDRAIRNDIDNRDLQNEDEVKALIEKALDDNNFASDSTVEDMGEGLNRLDNQVGTLANQVKRLVEDFESMTERLERRLDNLQGTLHSQVTRIETLEGMYTDLSERNETAMTFFGLIKQAFALLQR